MKSVDGPILCRTDIANAFNDLEANLLYANLQLRYWLLTFGLSLLLLPKIAAACVIVPKPTVLQAYESADVVVIARVISQEKSEEKSPFTGSSVLLTTMQVEKVFKGNLRVGDKMTFDQGNGIRCTKVFYEDAIGNEYLFYLESPPEGSRVWFEFGYSRSDLLSVVADDLLYLNRIDAVRGKTRVSGTLDPGDDDEDVFAKKIRIKGMGKVYETTTDKNGVYEFYGLRPGRYVLEPDVPAGWSIDPDTRGTTTITNPKRQIHTRHVVFTLKPRQHAAIDLSFVLDNALSGRVVDQRGKPMAKVQVSLRPTAKGNHIGHWDYTDEKGWFAIKAIEPGDYVLVLNKDGRNGSRSPFPHSTTQVWPMKPVRKFFVFARATTSKG